MMVMILVMLWRCAGVEYQFSQRSGFGKGVVLCYNIVGGARLVSTVSELRGRGGEVPKARLVWPHNERYLWLGRRVTRWHFLSQRE